MAQQMQIKFEKYIYDNGKEVFKLIKTKTNRYYLVDCNTKKIVASNKKEILEKIVEYKKEVENWWNNTY